MTQDEIIELAREAGIIHPEMVAKHLVAFATLVAAKEREALAQTQEPVAHWSDCAVHSEPAYPKGECDCGGFNPTAWLVEDADGSHLYWAYKEPIGNEKWTPLFSTPPQRTWVDLTDEDRNVINRQNVYVYEIILATEAKLKELNT